MKFLLHLFRAVWVPVLLSGLAGLLLYEPLVAWLQGEEKYDEEAIKEWVQEARVYQTLPVLAQELMKLRRDHEEEKTLVDKADRTNPLSKDRLHTLERLLENKRTEIGVHLEAMCDPTTKVYPGRLPLFVVVYYMRVHFSQGLGEQDISWESGRPWKEWQVRQLRLRIHDSGVWVEMGYQLRVYARHQYYEHQAVRKWRWLSALGLVFTFVASLGFYLSLRQQRERETHRLRAEQQASEAERLRLQEELKRREAEERQQEAERVALELRSQMFANIGIMAGSYAHNIKNLLVRPNDLLVRCLERDGMSVEQKHMLHEVRQTLGTVTERLQQILHTVRRDPSQLEKVPLDLNELVRSVHESWSTMATDKWKLSLRLDLAEGPVLIAGDRSHLMQALENLLFNARDATFEMRNYHRDQARKGSGAESPETGQQRRQALITAASWKGQIVLRTRREGEHVLLEVEDNGVGMTEEVRRRCTETHFSTKRDNALYAGLSAGMGLGLSFVLVILEHHRASLDVESQPLRGARFRLTFPVAGTAKA